MLMQVQTLLTDRELNNCLLFLFVSNDNGSQNFEKS